MIPRLIDDRRIVATIVLVWAGITWGTRIGLLTDAEAADPVTWLRVAGSLVTAALAAGSLLRSRPALARPAVALYGLWAVGTWGTSLLDVWTDPHPTGFRVVHTVLAVVTWTVAATAMRAAGLGPEAAASPEPSGSRTRSG